MSKGVHPPSFSHGFSRHSVNESKSLFLLGFLFVFPDPHVLHAGTTSWLNSYFREIFSLAPWNGFLHADDLFRSLSISFDPIRSFPKPRAATRGIRFVTEVHESAEKSPFVRRLSHTSHNFSSANFFTPNLVVERKHS
jgi:hypothetical protein